MPLAAMSLVTGLRPRCLPDAGRLRAGGGAPGPSLEGGLEGVAARLLIEAVLQLAMRSRSL